MPQFIKPSGGVLALSLLSIGATAQSTAPPPVASSATRQLKPGVNIAGDDLDEMLDDLDDCGFGI